MIEILGSGIALGVYVPPLLFLQSLEEKVYKNFTIIEEIFTEDKCLKILENKKIFHKSFRIAKKAHQLPVAIEQCIDQEKLLYLFKRWEKEKVDLFCIFSGFWIDVLKIYQNYLGRQVNSVCIHMDADTSNSWKNYKSKISCNDYWLFSEVSNSINYYFGLDQVYHVNPINDREEKVVIHGGGWGMGTYSHKVQDLIDRKIPVHYIQYEYDEMKMLKDIPNVSIYYLDEKWIPWNKETIYCNFPKMLVWSKREQRYVPFSNNNANLHCFYEILNSSLGIISKPGGGTLLDSYETNTPVIFLEPLGDYEKKNADLWIKNGFGLSYEHWKKNDFSYDILKVASNKIKGSKKNALKLGDVICNQKQK